MTFTELNQKENPLSKSLFTQVQLM